MSSGKYLSIDIGRRNIQLVVGRNKGNTVDVETWLTVPTPEGSVKEGNLIDRNAIAFAIRNALKDHRVGVKKAIVIIKSAAVITRELTIPNVTDRDLMPLVLLDMEQYVPNIAKDYRTGVTILEKISGTGEGSLRVRVFAMTNAMADSYADLLKSCDLKPVALDVQANALNKLVQRSYKLSNDKPGGWSWKLAAFVDLGFEQTEIDILNPEKLVFNRQIPYGSSFLDAELMRQMGFDDTNLNAKKIELCDLSRTDFDSDEARRFHDILRLYVSRVTNELSTVIQFYAGRVVEKRPEQIYIYGGNAHLKGLAATMEKAIGIPVQVLEDCPAIHANAKHQPLTVTPYVNAIAALARND